MDLSPDIDELVLLKRRQREKWLASKDDGEGESDKEKKPIYAQDLKLGQPTLLSTTERFRTNFDMPTGHYDSSELDYTNNNPQRIFDPTPTDAFKHTMNKFKNRKEAVPLAEGSIHFMNLPLLCKYVSDNGSILGRRATGLSGKDQRKVARAIKRARAVGIIPYVGGWSVEYGSGGGEVEM